MSLNEVGDLAQSLRIWDSATIGIKDAEESESVGEKNAHLLPLIAVRALGCFEVAPRHVRRPAAVGTDPREHTSFIVAMERLATRKANEGRGVHLMSGLSSRSQERMCSGSPNGV